MEETKNLFFSVPRVYGHGIRPRVGVAAGRVVEVHQLENQEDEIWYRLGTLRAGRVELEDSDTGYGKGMHPAVAVNQGGTVVAVHESHPPGSGRLYYHVSRLDAPPLFGGEALLYDNNGGRPQVALNDSGVVVAVHQVEPGKVRYKVGAIGPDGRTILFGSSLPPSTRDDGWTPSVAINNHGVVIMVHRWKAREGDYALWYHLGVVKSESKTIAFGERQWYEEAGANPSVALNDEGFVVVVHEWNGNLWGRTGELNDARTGIVWESPHFHGLNFQYHNGNSPSVDIDGTAVVQVDSRPDQDDSLRARLQCATSMFINRANWMADTLDLIGNRKLMEIAMPASHDAGMASARDCPLLPLPASSCNTKTQNHYIRGQLLFGCRYFDIRPVIDRHGAMRTGHFSVRSGGAMGCFGQTMEEALSDVKAYLQEGGRDLVILKFSHYFDIVTLQGFTEAQMRALLEQVTGALEPWLYDGEVPEGGLQSGTVSHYIGAGGKVLAVFDGFHDFGQSRGVFSYADAAPGDIVVGDLIVFDRYSGTNNLKDMIEGQLTYLGTAENHGSNLFLLSWTLTQSSDQATRCALPPGLGRTPSILDLALQANRAVWPSLAEAVQGGLITSASMPNLIYTDDIQGAQSDYAVALNLAILG